VSNSCHQARDQLLERHKAYVFALGGELRSLGATLSHLSHLYNLA
jgi:hypothetical protein